MRFILKLLGLAVVVGIVVGGITLAYVRTTGLRALPEPGRLETRVARAVRSLAVPSDAKSRINPFAGSAEAMREGLQHFARYCAMCHGNDGSIQKTPIGHGLFPKPPDLRDSPTQQLTDGELFYIIDNGVRFTGMPAFGTGTPSEAGDRQVWQLVTFIRHLPRITAAEVGWMESLNPL
jgi:mono/diheme cytochrome c family protein